MSAIERRLRHCLATRRLPIWAEISDAADEIKRLSAQVERAEGERDVLEANARVQAKLLADTGRERDALAAQVEIARRALERISESRRSDFKTLHPDGCAEEARSVLARWKQSTSTEQRS